MTQGYLDWMGGNSEGLWYLKSWIEYSPLAVKAWKDTFGL